MKDSAKRPSEPERKWELGQVEEVEACRLDCSVDSIQIGVTSQGWSEQNTLHR